jgi:flagellar biosynthesis GTPase FlhF
MFVKKFEADTIDEALKAVKAELGPDAIILKTITNKGLKGAFKKKRIEITAAVSEKNIEKKAKVDKVLNEEQKRDLYSRNASTVKETIDDYATPAGGAGSYGQMGLNKMVNQITRGTATAAAAAAGAAKSTSQALKQGLDDFLGDDDDLEMEDDARAPVVERRPAPKPAARPVQQQRDREVEPAPVAAAPAPAVSREARELINELRQELRTQQHRMEILEQKIHEMGPMAVAAASADAHGIYQLRTSLKALEVDESVVLDLVRKAAYELSKEELENPDVVFEFALREMTQSVNVSLPLFSTVDGEEPVITVLLSEAAAGQSSMSTKIAVLKKDVEIIQYSSDGGHQGGADFAAQVFGLKIHRAQNPAEIIQLCRKASESGKGAIVDLRLANKQHDETKKFIESLRRGFHHVEVLITVSAIHSELYNRKILSRYKDLADGLIISHVDLCLNFGALYNLHRANTKVPLKFFGTGPVVPDDIESATAERIMAGLFQLH